MTYTYHPDGTLPSSPKEYVFVFGSNTRGFHGKGAALVARNVFGAEYGVGIGITGRSYGIPTKDGNLQTLVINHIKSLICLKGVLVIVVFLSHGWSIWK